MIITISKNYEPTAINLKFELSILKNNLCFNNTCSFHLKWDYNFVFEENFEPLPVV